MDAKKYVRGHCSFLARVVGSNRLLVWREMIKFQKYFEKKFNRTLQMSQGVG